MFYNNKWQNFHWPFDKRPASNWMRYQKYPGTWADNTALRQYMTAWVNNWLKDTWGNDDIWQSLDSTLNKSVGPQSKTDIAYGEQPWQMLDVFTPEKNHATKKPVLVFFYGGGWHDGNKEKYRFIANTFTDLGYVVVIPDYVKYPTGRFPEFIFDGAKALGWVKNNVGKYGGDTQKIVLAGHSAGAHLGALLSTDQRYLDTVDICLLYTSDAADE